MPHAEIRKWTLPFSHVQALSGTQTSCFFIQKKAKQLTNKKNRLLGINACYRVNEFSNRGDCCTGWFCTCTFNSVRCPVLQAEPRNVQRLAKADTPPFSSRWPETGAVLSRRHCHIQMKLLHFQLKGNVLEHIPLRLWARRVRSRASRNRWFTLGEECVESRVHTDCRPLMQSAKITVLNVFQTRAVWQKRARKLCRRGQKSSLTRVSLCEGGCTQQILKLFILNWFRMNSCELNMFHRVLKSWKVQEMENSNSKCSIELVLIVKMQF